MSWWIALYLFWIGFGVFVYWVGSKGGEMLGPRMKLLILFICIALGPLIIPVGLWFIRRDNKKTEEEKKTEANQLEDYEKIIEKAGIKPDSPFARMVEYLEHHNKESE